MSARKGQKFKPRTYNEKARATILAHRYGIDQDTLTSILLDNAALMLDELNSERKVFIDGIGTLSFEKARFKRQYIPKYGYMEEMFGEKPVFTPRRAILEQLWARKVKMPPHIREIWRSDPRTFSELASLVA